MDVTLAQALAGPLGGLIALVAIGAAVMTGRLRLGREVVAVETLYQQEREERRRWEALAMRQLQMTDRAITLADSTVRHAS